MAVYKAPLKDINFVLNEVLDVSSLVAAGRPGPVITIGGTSMTLVHVDHLTLKGGSHTAGGCVDVAAGRAFFEDVAITGCRSSGTGGAVQARAQTTFAGTDVDISDSYAGTDGGGVW